MKIKFSAFISTLFVLLFAGSIVCPFDIQRVNVYPKIITPNGDGYNDRLFIKFFNPYDNQIDGKVYNLQGCEIADLHLGASEDYFYWDGVDSGGRPVDPGAYVFQISGEGEIFQGIVIVAR